MYAIEQWTPIRLRYNVLSTKITTLSIDFQALIVKVVWLVSFTYIKYYAQSCESRKKVMINMKIRRHTCVTKSDVYSQVLKSLLWENSWRVVS